LLLSAMIGQFQVGISDPEYIPLGPNLDLYSVFMNILRAKDMKIWKCQGTRALEILLLSRNTPIALGTSGALGVGCRLGHGTPLFLGISIKIGHAHVGIILQPTRDPHPPSCGHFHTRFQKTQISRNTGMRDKWDEGWVKQWRWVGGGGKQADQHACECRKTGKCAPRAPKWTRRPRILSSSKSVI
jgi:hypothetical protein